MAATIVMGIAGCGKTALGKALADRLSYAFIEGDDCHPPDNIAKMANGQALNDEDRWPWLSALAGRIGAHSDCIASCSALKRGYRDYLRHAIQMPVKFIYLSAQPDLLAARLDQRADHFMQRDMLDSQWAIFEEPQAGEQDIVTVDASLPIERLIIETSSHF